LHHFYKNRLVRCYLGAGNAASRSPNPYTGFDPRDDFPVSDLLPRDGSASPGDAGPGSSYSGPFALLNTALNLNVGSELAQQERKATSFVFTPAFCGFMPQTSRRDSEAVERGVFSPSGYTTTTRYTSSSGPHLGTAVAISGAAANPNS